MRNFILYLLFTTSVAFAQDFAKHVNPFIGTGGHGHTFPGVTTPYGMVQLSPDTRIDGSWDGCSGYHYSDNVIYGFSHTHLNGTGVSDFGDILLMPTMGKPSFKTKDYTSKFSHDNEQASAGFYAVKLDKYDIDVRLTASTRVGFHEYTFNKSGQANVILDLNHRDKLLEGTVRVINDRTVEVLRRSDAWANNQYVYARIEFNMPMKISKTRGNNFDKKFFSDRKLALSFSKHVEKGEKILIKVALSPTSYEGAKLNSSEIPDWDFGKVHQDAVALWNKELSKIEVSSTDSDKLAIFYTALYHTMMQPNIAQDLDGKYRGRDNKIHTAVGFDYYTVFSLWDTFRAAHPLYTLIDKKRTVDYINTFLMQYEQGGRLPVWELASNETDCMIGYHSVSVIADAMSKGIKGFDYEKAFEASKASAMRDVLGLKEYKKNGFIAIDDEHESVSKTLEYAYDDWCIAQMAQILDKKEDYEYFMKRSQSWKNLFDWKIGFIRPRKNGGWEKNFDPREVNNSYTEGNGWQYTFFVPQDIDGMIAAYGGPKKFEAKLDEMFNSESKTTGREQVDVTGLIGQYAHGNEPSHHMAYLYNYISKPEKTTEKVHYILDEFYKNAPDGLIGNEDCGQMSAWYILSSMGIYAVTPGNGGVWATTKPYFDSVTLHLENESSRVINKPFESEFTDFGFEDALELTDNEDFKVIVPAPVINAKSKSFKDKLIVTFDSFDSELTYFYSINGLQLEKFQKELVLDESATIEFYSDNGSGRVSDTISAQFFKKPNDYTVAIKSKYNPLYTAGGKEGLIDGIYGSENWRKGDWQGYQDQDFEAVIDLQEEKDISKLSASFLQDTRAWILMPTKVDFYVSNDNKSFKKITSVTNKIDPKEYNIVLQKLGTTVNAKGRYVKVIAKNFGKLPEWHQAYPYKGYAFIFIDEIEIE
ncbi:GH92 family glycosyl hydrolase [Flavobacterium chuncheonense]|uniref:GH92 family glycosyl hydrolase n=1 Tax=Flavobacterium chuncheonense TaxID=2026653 RepID=A0ABW5YM57_9FLAO